MTNGHVGSDDRVVDVDEDVAVLLRDEGDIWPVVSRLRPSGEVLERLYGVEDPVRWDEWPEWVHPIDTGIRLNDRPWGWSIAMDRHGFDDDAWFLLPMGFFDQVTELAGISMCQEASMTGAVITTTCLWSNGAYFGWQVFDEEGVTWRTLTLSEDPEQVAREFIGESVGFAGPVCPVCDESGWEIEIGLAPQVRAAVGPAALASVWVPCVDHIERAQVELGGWWRWEPAAVDGPSDAVRAQAATFADAVAEMAASLDAQLNVHEPGSDDVTPRPPPASSGAWVPVGDGPAGDDQT